MLPFSVQDLIGFDEIADDVRRRATSTALATRIDTGESGEPARAARSIARPAPPS